jgi:protein TonB
MDAATTLQSRVLPAAARPRPWRVAAWLAASLALHAALMLLAGPTTPRPVGRVMPLVVELQPAPAEPEGVLPAPAPAVDTIPLPQAPASPPPPAEFTHPPKPPAPASERPIEPPFLPDRYFSGREVDVRAEPLNDVQLVYPEKALLYRTAGTVIVTFYINERGGVDRIELGAAKPPGIFEEAALEAARALQFSPALRNGRPVKSRKTIEVTFDPYARAAQPGAPAPGR